MKSFLLVQKFRKLKPLWHSLSRSRKRQLFYLQIISIVSAASEVANIGALLPFLNILSNPDENLSKLGPLSSLFLLLPRDQLPIILGFTFISIIILSALLRIITIISQQRLAALLTSDLSKIVFGRTIYMPYDWHVSNNSSVVLGHLSKDIDQVSTTIRSSLAFFINISIVISLGITLFLVSPIIMTVLCFSLISFYLLLFKFTKTSLRADGLKLTTNYQQSLQVVQEACGSVRDVIIDKKQSFFLDAYNTLNLKYRMSVASINIKAQVPRYFIESFTIILLISIALFLTIIGDNIQESLPILGAIALGCYRLLQPLQQCFSAIANAQANQASLSKITPFLNTDKSKLYRQDFTKNSAYSISSFDSKIKNLSLGEPLIQLRNVSFKYNDSDTRWILNNINLTVNVGDKVAFVGTTGSGKSTLSDIILGLLKPTLGNLYICDKDITNNDYLLPVWHSNIAHVPQSIYLVDSDFASNIAFGEKPDEINYDKIEKAANIANISETIENTPLGYSSHVGERGIKLSGGQRQRIGIARAFYKSSRLLLLDEATSALDNRTEGQIISNINDLSKSSTIIMIAHRLSTIKTCDKILMFRNGEIIASGTYESLINHNEDFKKLANQTSIAN